jgi:hypothetical protein
VSGDPRRRLTRGRIGELIGELEELLERISNGPTADRDPRPLRAGAPTPPPTAWQGYAGELRDLCRRVLEEADEETAVGFWLFLIETAARHGRRAGGWPG